MKLVIFGATGTVGRQIVDQALAAGHHVTGFSRRPEAGGAATWIRGDVSNFAHVTEAVKGQGAVIVALGAGRKGMIRALGTAHIIAAMQAHGVRRLICQSTLGAGDSYGNLNFFWKRVMFGLLLRPAFRDHQRQEAHVRASGLDWTIVRPGAFTDGPLTGRYRHGFAPRDRKLALKISRADVAHFLLSLLGDRSSVGATPGLSY